ncbi:MAG TPA: pitrilysin family protein [Thermoanaerobaculia bacterium]|nr:pitrilysin family protein [Thermoanaerobaculia bacterium]
MTCVASRLVASGAALAGLLALASGARAVGSDDGPTAGASGVEELVLENGMRFLLVQRPGRPLVAAGWAVHAGSAAEEPGRTGVAHLIEHLLHGGSEVIGTRDYPRERALIEQREALEDERRAGAGGAELEPRIARVEERLRALRRKGEYALIYTEAGALGINAVTNHDLSYYTAMLPRSRLELWFWMESDRLLRPVFREIYDELEVVEEERAQRILSVPGGEARARFDARFWGEEHPYSWPAVGRAADLRGLRRADVEAFFGRYYTADRLTAVLVGDLDRERVGEWARRYFGRLSTGGAEAAAGAPEQASGGRRAPAEQVELTEACSCRPMVELRFATVPFAHRDAPVLDVIAGLLSGRTGRLHRRLVVERNLAFSASVRHEPQRRGGSFSLIAESGPTSDLAVLELALLAELERLRREPPNERELGKVKNQITTDASRQLSTPSGLAQRLLIYDALGDWRWLEEWPRVAQRVTVDDLERVLDAYLDPKRRAVLRLERGDVHGAWR